MTDVTFKAFLSANRNGYILVVLPPLIVFTISFFMTNIGWLVAPVFLGVVGFLVGVKTLTLYNVWDKYCNRKNDRAR